jgi:hypothetical protein
MLWIALAACGSALLLAITTHLSKNVAPIPLLWVVTLGTYLVSLPNRLSSRRSILAWVEAHLPCSRARF